MTTERQIQQEPVDHPEQSPGSVDGPFRRIQEAKRLGAIHRQHERILEAFLKLAPALRGLKEAYAVSVEKVLFLCVAMDTESEQDWDLLFEKVQEVFQQFPETDIVFRDADLRHGGEPELEMILPPGARLVYPSQV